MVGAMPIVEGEIHEQEGDRSPQELEAVLQKLIANRREQPLNRIDMKPLMRTELMPLFRDELNRIKVKT